jgi:lincosamide nucleotidyltransferase A/C/D/E
MPELSGKNRQPQASMSADRAVAILDLLERRGVAAWLDGGWGIDALLGKQTRMHDDLDVLVRLDQLPQLEAALAELGYATARGVPPESFEAVDSQGHQVDVHPVSFAPTGEGVYKMESGGDWTYPASAFTGAGSILGRAVTCLTPEVMMVSHTTGYALDAAHKRDVEALSERFRIPLAQLRTTE